MLLIITSKQDGHVGPVVEHFTKYWTTTKIPFFSPHNFGSGKPPLFETKKTGIEWIRINTEDIATNLRFTIRPDTGESLIQVLDSNRSFSLDQITSVWYRKPEPANLEHLALTDATLDYVEAEFNEILMGIYAVLHDRLWINDPFETRLAQRKLLQLKIAREVGFRIPKTLVSNDETRVLSFARENGWDLALKSLGALNVTNYQGERAAQQFGIFTRRINQEELMAVKSTISNLPTQYQSYIKKKFELRITCVGNQIFGCKIDSQSSEKNKEDMRFDLQSAKHEVFDCGDIADKLLSYLNYFNLNFGCFDIAVDENDEYVFFECNPNGQWLWVEHQTGLKISETIADLLIAPSNPQRFNR